MEQRGNVSPQQATRLSLKPKRYVMSFSFTLFNSKALLRQQQQQARASASSGKSSPPPPHHHGPDQAESLYAHGSWSHLVQLSLWQYVEGLLDQRHFLKWSVDQFSVSNFDQTTVMIPLVRHLILEYSKSRALSRLFMEACIRKIERVPPVLFNLFYLFHETCAISF